MGRRKLSEWRLSRRHLLASSLAVAGIATIPGSQDRVRASSVQAYVDGRGHDPHGRIVGTYPPEMFRSFLHGVASGDPLPRSVVLWTRVTPAPQAVPGSGLGPDTTVEWEIARDEGFTATVATGTAVATAARDHTIHVDSQGLEPATTYFYRFRILDGAQAGDVSPVGRTRTTPADDADMKTLNLAVCSCANYESGYFRAYSDIAAREEIDAVIHLGDYIYEYASGVNPGKSGVSRPFVPTWELLRRSDYQARYGHYRMDPELQAAHAAAPWVVIWDDHEIVDNWHRGGALGHDMFAGPWEPRCEAGMRAYLDWMPVRATNPADGGRLYRSVRFGTLAELHMLDLRTYRSGPGVLRPASSGTRQSIMGQEQFDWLRGKLSTTDTTWSVIGNSVMMSAVNLVGIDPRVGSQLAGMIGGDTLAELTPSMNPDQWDGYPADRDRLLAEIAARRPDGSTVFLTGDIHSEWAGVLRRDDRVIAAELVGSSVSATNVDDRLGLPVGNPVSQAAQRHLRSCNPHFSHIKLDDHGYLLVTFDRSGVDARWMRVDDVEAPGSPVRQGYALRYQDGQLRPL